MLLPGLALCRERRACRDCSKAACQVFDGHGGTSAAEFARTHLLASLLAHAAFPGAARGGAARRVCDDGRGVLPRGMLACDESLAYAHTVCTLPSNPEL